MDEDQQRLSFLRDSQISAGAWGCVAMLFGPVVAIGGAVIFITGVHEDKTFGAIVFFVGLLVWGGGWIAGKIQEKHAADPILMDGFSIDADNLMWGPCRIDFAEEDQNEQGVRVSSMDTSDQSTRESSASSGIVILLGVQEEQIEVVGIALQSEGEVVKSLLCGNGIRFWMISRDRGRVVPSWMMSAQTDRCFEALEMIAETMKRSPASPVPTRVKILPPGRTGFQKIVSGVAGGMAAGATGSDLAGLFAMGSVSSAQDEASRRRIQELVDNGRLRNSETDEDILTAIARHGWSLELA